jgi:hypothetical protein
MDMPDFRLPDVEFTTPEAMRMNRYVRPQRYFLRKLFNAFHYQTPLNLSMRVHGASIQP